jgi:hypothetical protein
MDAKGKKGTAVLAPPSDVTARLRSGLAGQPSHILAKAEPVDRLAADELPLLAMSRCSHHQPLPNWACQAAQGRRAMSLTHLPPTTRALLITLIHGLDYLQYPHTEASDIISGEGVGL